MAIETPRTATKHANSIPFIALLIVCSPFAYCFSDAR